MPGFEVFGDEERREVHEVLDTGVLFRYGFDQARKGRWKAKALETEVAKRVGAAHCHVCSSGTAALWTALAACGVGAGDEVIVPPFTFIATIEAVLLAGAVPVFGEIDETLCLDPEWIRSHITPKTRAVLPVHMCGAMAHIDEITAICHEKGLILIEDACQAFGATFQGKGLGTFGMAGCFSFDAVKTITCGEGGALVTNSRDIYDRADGYADHGHDHIGNDRGLEGHPILGTNFRISELNAAVGLAQLRKLNVILETQRRHKRAIKDAASSLPGLRYRDIPDEEGDSATFLSFFLAGEQEARATSAGLARRGVDGAFYWYDNNWHYLRNWDHFKNLHAASRLPLALLEDGPDYRNLELPRSDDIMKRTISLQIKLSWTEDELADRIGKILEVMRS